ncbi:hypothetical protein [Bartonella birtlesii]|uniref:Uncharacterized protein n=1 Tax=Bartonella birtlesii LL-WM9 TaxID=1094552 RepID=J0PXM0_9HYPH|nr:hypothetical protein [Bartonella birtlesii]EJF74929.1 hypothetical protein ME7_01300 [Bartonella birtlesii LL-WM9]
MGGLREFRNIKKSNLYDFFKYEGIFNHEGDYWGKYHIDSRGFIKNERVWVDTIFFNDVSICTNSYVYEGRQIYCILPVFSIVSVCSSAQMCDSGGVCGGLYVYKEKIYYNLSIYSNAHADVYVHVYHFVEIFKSSKSYIDVLIYVYAKVCNRAEFYGCIVGYNREDFRNEKGIFIGSYILDGAKNLGKNDVGEGFFERVLSLALFENICAFAFFINKYAANSLYEKKDLGSFYETVFDQFLACFDEVNKGTKRVLLHLAYNFLHFFDGERDKRTGRNNQLNGNKRRST